MNYSGILWGSLLLTLSAFQLSSNAEGFLDNREEPLQYRLNVDGREIPGIVLNEDDNARSEACPNGTYINKFVGVPQTAFIGVNQAPVRGRPGPEFILVNKIDAQTEVSNSQFKDSTAVGRDL